MQACSQHMFRLAVVTTDGVHWHLGRNCSVSPKQLGLMFVALGAGSVGIAAFFWFKGATLVMPFALMEVAALVVALAVHARHATDAERISLIDNALVVELESGGQASRTEFSRFWVQVGAGADPQSLIEVSGSGQKVAIGRHLRPEMRLELGREIKLALQSAWLLPEEGFPHR